MVNFIWDNLFKKEAQKNDPVLILKENFLFQDLSSRELQFVREMIHTRSYRTGEAIFKQAEVGVGMYILVSGSVEIVVEDYDSEKKGKTFVTQLTPQDFFGELSLVEDRGRRSASAYATSDSVLLGFFKPDLMEIVSRNPATGAKILYRLGQVLGKRLKETTGKVAQLKKELKSLSGDHQ